MATSWAMLVKKVWLKRRSCKRCSQTLVCVELLRCAKPCRVASSCKVVFCEFTADFLATNAQDACNSYKAKQRAQNKQANKDDYMLLGVITWASVTRSSLREECMTTWEEALAILAQRVTARPASLAVFAYQPQHVLPLRTDSSRPPVSQSALQARQKKTAAQASHWPHSSSNDSNLLRRHGKGRSALRGADGEEEAQGQDDWHMAGSYC